MITIAIIPILLPVLPLLPHIHSIANNLVSDLVILDSSLSHPHHHFTHLQRRLGAMDPTANLIIDELNKRFTEQDDKWEQRFFDFDCQHSEKDNLIDRRPSDLEHSRSEQMHEERDGRVTALESTSAVIEA